MEKIRNKVKKNKGITIVALVIIVVILVIVTAVMVANINTRYQSQNLDRLASDLQLLQEKAGTYYVENGDYPKTGDEISIDSDDNDAQYYEMDLSKLSGLTLNYGNDGGEDVYLIDVSDGSVYYQKGIEYRGTEYHELAEMNTANVSAETVLKLTDQRVQVTKDGKVSTIALTRQTQYIQLAASDSVMISVTANEEGTYQWYKDGVAITGAINPNYTVPTLKDGEQYYCKVTYAGMTKDSTKVVISLSDRNILVDSITIAPKPIKLDFTDGPTEAQLTATIIPENATNQNITWTSRNPSVATVDQTGKVTAVANGSTTIVATTDDGPVDTCRVNVVTSISNITLADATIDLTRSSTLTLTPTIEPNDATETTLTWNSSNTDVARVDNSGNITAYQTGTTTITATTSNGHEASCTVTVIDVTGITVTPETNSVDLYDTEEEIQLTATVTPDSIANKNVTWSSSDTNIATVDENGKVTVLSAGEEGSTTVTITATTARGNYQDTCVITVTQRNTGVTISDATLNLDLPASRNNSTATLTATISPSNAANKNVTWSSNNTNVATVDQEGNVTAVGAGSATITVTTQDGGNTATCIVNVTQHDEEVQISDSSIDLHLPDNATRQLTATVLPNNAINKNVTWSSSNDNVATVDQEGNVTAISAGSTGRATATITVTTQDGGNTATCTVNVIQDVTGVQISDSSIDLHLPNNTTKQLTATILPSNAANKNVTWSSSNDSVATVDQEGNVTAISAGSTGRATATITVTTQDGGNTATCTVNVIQDVTGVQISDDSIDLHLPDNTTKQLTATISPSNAANKNVTWSSSNDSVATVDQEGNVTAVGAGSATITATTQDGGNTATCIVNVTQHDEEVQISDSSIDLHLPDNATRQLTATVLPDNAINKNVTWSSSNTNVATVDQEGNVTAISAGSTGRATATITVTTADRGNTATCEVNVIQDATGISMNPTNVTLETDGVNGFSSYADLTATISPSNASNKNITWSSSNGSVVSFSESSDSASTTTSTNSATVRVYARGSATGQTVTITATAEDGSYAATCTVIVNPEAQINTTSYTTLPEAINVVGSTQTEVKLLRDISGSLNYTIANGKNVKLNLQNHNIASSYSGYTITNNGTLEITGTGTISNSTNNHVIYNPSGKTLTISGGTISGYGGVFNSYGTLTMTGGTIAATGSYGIHNNNGYATIDNTSTGTDIAISSNSVAAIRNYSGSSSYRLNINAKATSDSESGKIEITSNSSYGIYNYVSQLTIGNDDETVNQYYPRITGASYGIYRSSGTCNYYDGVVLGSTSYSTSIYGESNFNIPANYKIMYTTENSKRKDYLGQPEAQIGSTYYLTLADAITAAGSSQTEISLLRDITPSNTYTIDSGKNVKLNLNNHTIRSSYNGYSITNNGTLEITGTGTFSNSTNNYVIYNPSGKTLTISGGTVSGYMGVDNRGTLDMTGGTISPTGSYAIYSPSGSTTTMRGNATVSSTSSEGIYNYGTLTLQDNATVSVTGNYGIRNYATFTMTGGSVSATTHAIRNYGASATFTITGGTVYGGTYGIYTYNANSKLYIGENDTNDPETDYPEIKGGQYGVYRNNGNIYFYDGKLIGGSSYSGINISQSDLAGIPDKCMMITYTNGSQKETTLVKDATPPTIEEFTATANDYMIWGTIKITDEGSGFDHAEIVITNTATSNIEDRITIYPGDTTYEFTGGSSNTYYDIDVYAYDKAGNETTEWKGVATDPQTPWLDLPTREEDATWLVPDPRDIPNNIWYINYVQGTEEGVYYEYTFNGGSTWRDCTTWSTSDDCTVDITSEGIFAINVRAKNASNMSDTYYVRVDGTGPTISRFTPSSSYNSVTLTTAATDSIAGIQKYVYYYSTGGYSYSNAKTVTTTSTSNSITLSGLSANTTYYYIVRAYDNAGNYSESRTYQTTQAINVNNVTIYPTNLFLSYFGTTTSRLTATVYPSNATNKSVTWSTNDSSIATVDSNGNVTAQGPGETTITVRTNDGGYTATCTVHVDAGEAKIGSTYYETLTKAIEACPTNSGRTTITILKDIISDVGYTIPSNKNIRIDFLKYRLTFTESMTAGTAITNNGSLTITGNTSLYSRNVLDNFIKNTGNLTLDGGDYTTAEWDSDYGGYYYGTMFINGARTGIYNDYGTVTIYEGEVRGPVYGIYNNYGTVKMSHGVINSSGGVAVWNLGTFEMSNGTINAGAEETIYNYGTATITGGNISNYSEGYAIVNYGYGHSLTISGATEVSAYRNYGIYNQYNSSLYLGTNDGYVNTEYPRIEGGVNRNSGNVYFYDGKLIGYQLNDPINMSNTTSGLYRPDNYYLYTTTNGSQKETILAKDTISPTITNFSATSSTYCNGADFNLAAYDNESGIQQYIVYYSTSYYGTYTQCASGIYSGSSNINLTVNVRNNSLSASTGYYFKVTVTDKAGNSSTSGPIYKATGAHTNPTGISITSPTSSVSLKQGNSQYFYASVTGGCDHRKDITWTTSNSSIASLSTTSGSPTRVTASSSYTGSATITAKPTYNTSVSATRTVNVTSNTIYATGITLSSTQLYIPAGSSATISATLSPSNVTNKNINWTSSDGSAVSFASSYSSTSKTSSSGNSITVYARNGNGATLTARSADGSVVAYCYINYACKSTSTYYNSVQDGVNALSSGTLTLLKQIDITDYISIPSNKTITISMNGYNINASNTDAIHNSGRLTLSGSGTVYGSYSTYYYISPKDNGWNYYNTIYNSGTLTIKDNVTVELRDSNGENAAIYNIGTVTMTGGIVNSTERAVYNSGSYSMSSGIIATTGYNSKSIATSGTTSSKISISGGTIYSGYGGGSATSLFTYSGSLSTTTSGVYWDGTKEVSSSSGTRVRRYKVT